MEPRWLRGLAGCGTTAGPDTESSEGGRGEGRGGEGRGGEKGIVMAFLGEQEY